MTNRERLQNKLAEGKPFIEWLYDRDCNCWECSEDSPQRCDENCKKHMLEWLDEEYRGCWDE